MNGLSNLDDLFQAAQGDGLTADTLDLVISNLNGPTMMGPVGAPLAQLTSNDVTLAMNVIDVSGSMAPYAADLIRAYNEDYLDAMAASPVADDILLSTVLFNDSVSLLHGYVNLADAPRLTARTYAPDGATALYDAVAGALTNMVLYAQQLRQSGISARGVLVVYSDGEDNASKQRAKDVRRAAQELLKQEIYTLAFVGFVSGGQPIGFHTGKQVDPVRKLADEIGFAEAFRAGLKPGDLRRLFHMASFATMQMSRSGAVPAGVFA